MQIVTISDSKICIKFVPSPQIQRTKKTSNFAQHNRLIVNITIVFFLQTSLLDRITRLYNGFNYTRVLVFFLLLFIFIVHLLLCSKGLVSELNLD